MPTQRIDDLEVSDRLTLRRPTGTASAVLKPDLVGGFRIENAVGPVGTLRGDAHGSLPWVAARYYGYPTSATVATVALREYAIPFVVPTGASIDRLGINVSTLGAGALYRCVIRAALASGAPGAVIVDGGGDLDASTTGIKEHTITATSLPAGLVWLCVLTNASGTATLTTGSALYPEALSVGASALTTNPGSLIGTLASYTVDSATFAGGGAVATSTSVPLIKVRAA